MAHHLPINDIRFLTDFHAYCLTRGDESYNYCSVRDCACAQFLKDTGRATNPRVGWGWEDNEGVEHVLPEGLDDALVGRDDNRDLDLCCTFSALATRIEALLVDAPVVSSPA